MPQLTNPRMEAMAQGLAAGKTNSQAYRDAGYSGKTTTAAFKTANRTDIIVRKAEIIRERHEAERKAMDGAIEQEKVSRGYLISRLKYLSDSSIRGTKPVYDDKGIQTGWHRTAGDGQVAHSCLRTMAQMGGYLVDKVEIGTPGDFARLTDDELEKELITIGESIGIPAEQLQKAIAGRVTE